MKNVRSEQTSLVNVMLATILGLLFMVYLNANATTHNPYNECGKEQSHNMFKCAKLDGYEYDVCEHRVFDKFMECSQ